LRCKNNYLELHSNFFGRFLKFALDGRGLLRYKNIIIKKCARD